MKKFLIPLLMAGGLTVSSCGILGDGTILNSQSRQSLAGQAVKDLLLNGVLKGINNLGSTNGSLNNNLYKLLLPNDVANVINTLEDLGLGSLVGNVKNQINQGAQQAIATAQPIFVNAVKNITLMDAIQLVNGGQNSITNFFREKTSLDLMNAFKPIVAQKLDGTEALSTYSTIADAVNSIPFSNKKITTDLSEFVAQQMMNAMFTQIANEEVNIRQNVGARTTDVLRQVFANAGNF